MKDYQHKETKGEILSYNLPSPIGEGQGERPVASRLRLRRYVQTMDLKDDPELIKEYRKRHSREFQWKEIRDGIREVGILEMDIYLLGTRLVMIVEAPEDFDWDQAMARLATLPRQQEWEDYMAIFQHCEPGQTSAEKWHLMDRIFHIYENED